MTWEIKYWQPGALVLYSARLLLLLLQACHITCSPLPPPSLLHPSPHLFSSSSLSSLILSPLLLSSPPSPPLSSTPLYLFLSPLLFLICLLYLFLCPFHFPHVLSSNPLPICLFSLSSHLSSFLSPSPLPRFPGDFCPHIKSVKVSAPVIT